MSNFWTTVFWMEKPIASFCFSFLNTFFSWSFLYLNLSYTALYKGFQSNFSNRETSKKYYKFTKKNLPLYYHLQRYRHVGNGACNPLPLRLFPLPIRTWQPLSVSGCPFLQPFAIYPAFLFRIFELTQLPWRRPRPQRQRPPWPGWDPWASYPHQPNKLKISKQRFVTSPIKTNFAWCVVNLLGRLCKFGNNENFYNFAEISYFFHIFIITNFHKYKIRISVNCRVRSPH